MHDTPPVRHVVKSCIFLDDGDRGIFPPSVQDYLFYCPWCRDVWLFFFLTLNANHPSLGTPPQKSQSRLTSAFLCLSLFYILEEYLLLKAIFNLIDAEDERLFFNCTFH